MVGELITNFRSYPSTKIRYNGKIIYLNNSYFVCGCFLVFLALITFHILDTLSEIRQKSSSLV